MQVMTLVGRGFGANGACTKRCIYKQMEKTHYSHKCIKRAVHNQCTWHIMTISPSPNLLVPFIMMLGLDGWGLNPSRGTIVLYSVTSGPIPGPTQPPTQWVLGCFPMGKADYSLPSSAEVKNGGAILPLLHMSFWHSA
jgi:hypothetical protein